MPECPTCRHHELAQLLNGELHLCYRPELLIDGGGSLCSVNRADGGRCANAEYFEAKEEKRGDVA